MKRQLFEEIRLTKPGRNVFDLSQERKLSCNMGDLVPIMCQEVVPGDKFKVSSELLMRLAPLVSPVMHRVNVFTHFYFVPNRLTYKEWPDFITGGETGSSVPSFPQLSYSEARRSQFVKGSLADYLGIPVPKTGTMLQGSYISALPFRAYQLIYNEYYRDQNLQSKVAVTDASTVTGGEDAVITVLRKRAWEKDYFTSCLPYAQKGGSVSLPSTNTVTYKDAKTSGAGANTNGNITNVAGNPGAVNTPGGVIKIENIQDISTSITITDLRRAARLQEWLEKNARSGSRYVESILAHFGIKSSDQRLQRPEYLGGGKQPVVISEVLNTSATATEPQGNMAGHGISVGNTNAFQKEFEEHGYIIAIMSVLPITSYQQGMSRLWTKFDKFDYFWPEFAHIGEQAVLNSEIYFPTTEAAGTYNKDSVFGYQSRYAEYKFNESTVHGDFRDNLAFWTMGRIFANGPNLNDAFIKSDPTHRVFAVTDTNIHKLYVQVYHNIKAIRPMPVFGDPIL